MDPPPVGRAGPAREGRTCQREYSPDSTQQGCPMDAPGTSVLGPSRSQLLGGPSLRGIQNTLFATRHCLPYATQKDYHARQDSDRPSRRTLVTLHHSGPDTRQRDTPGPVELQATPDLGRGLGPVGRTTSSLFFQLSTKQEFVN